MLRVLYFARLFVGKSSIKISTLVRCRRKWAFAGGVVPEVEAPEGSGFAAFAFGTEGGLGRVPDVDGVGDERGLLVVVELVELVFAGVGAVAGGAAGGATLTNVFVGPKGCSLGTVVQLY
jgi:hypothetical protein